MDYPSITQGSDGSTARFTSLVTALGTSSSSVVNDSNCTRSFVSFRCRPTLTTLPPELLSKISYNLSLCEYSFLSRTCSRLHLHLFHPAEVVLFLKTRYRLSIQSGSIIIFAYLANMQVRAPLLLERIFEDFFADSPLQQQEAQKWKQQRQQHRQQLGNRTSQLNQTTSSKDIAANNRSSLDYQRMEGIEVHKAAEKARRQAKWDAVRMLGVLYALDKTHIGPSSSTNALVLSGACDPPEPVPHIPASALTITTVALNDTADPVNAELETAIQDSSSLSSASDSSSTLMTIATTVTGLDEAATPPSLSLTNSPSASATVSDFSPLIRKRNEEVRCRQQESENVPRSRSTSLGFSDSTHQYHRQPQHMSTTLSRAIRRSPSTLFPSKDLKISSSASSSSWWDSPLVQTHPLSENSRLSPARARSPPSSRHHHLHSHQRLSSFPSPNPSSSISSISAVPESRIQRKETQGGNAAASTSGDIQLGENHPQISPSPPSPSLSTFSISPFSTKTSQDLNAQQDGAQQWLLDGDSRFHVKSCITMKKQCQRSDKEMMESIEQSDDLVQDSCWANKLDQDQDFEMNAPTYLHQEYTYTDHGRGKWCQENIMTIPAADEELYMQDEDDVIMDLINEDSNSVRSESCNAEASLNYEANPKIPTGSLSRAYSSSSSSPQSYRSVLYDSENRSGLESTPLGISIPTIESNTTGGNSSGKEWQLGKGSSKSSSRDNSNAYDNDSSSSSLKMKVSSSTTLSSSSMPLDFAFRHPKEHHTQQEKEQDFLPQQSISCNESTTSATPPKNASTNITNASSTTDSSTTATVQASNSGATDTAGAQQRLQQILNRNDKIAFLTKYTDRMHLKLQALGIEDWGQGDIQRKKTYQLMIQHNDKTGEKDLVNFYLGRYGGSVTRSTEANTMQEDQQPTVETDTEAGMVTLGQQEGEQRTPLVAQA